MTKPNPVNVAASVRQRLLNIARRTGEDFQALLTRYALERLLYRLGSSHHHDSLVLKGAFLFIAWGEAASRPTNDLDFLASEAPDIDRFEALIKETCALEAPYDGIEYNPGTVRGVPIREQSLDDGIRIRLTANLGTALLQGMAVWRTLGNRGFVAQVGWVPPSQSNTPSEIVSLRI